MQKIWFITNTASGTATDAKAEAICAVFAERGLAIAGRTSFPDQDLPTGEELDDAGADTVALFAGDGTINAAVCALAKWQGKILILPGGTMNLLAKSLHGNADPAAIIHAAYENGEIVSLPYVEAGKHRALVGLILGPATAWVHARELVRKGTFRGLGRAISHAWRRTFSRGIKLIGVPGLTHRAQAVFVRPGHDHLDVAAVDARDFRAIAALGWDWVSGDWVASRAVTQVFTERFNVGGRKPVLALFDGEPVMLDPLTVISGGQTNEMFLRTFPPA
ncbi:diacylglycerol/lipid kinase family protein [Sphingomonas immobilis]|uniref:Diacylglycerol kinase family protein n=1 Tax=Sphingomonas immobilis TaxID=3063997 RepID=A0ABT9A0A7_9SPHN|nr:diacylglycerol kinase family protein [Sphingomonas sp. CA1-15]MDO7843263.1 diacylglycerol kinase family protein [Sphingomonas sp. CA1-15]